MNQRNWHIQHIRDYYIHLRKEHAPAPVRGRSYRVVDPTFGKFPWLPLCDL